MQALAVLLFLAAAACLYLAAPNQVLVTNADGNHRTPVSPRLLCGMAVALTLAGTWAMSVPEGWPVAIAATLVTLTCSLSLWPFLGTWRHHHRDEAMSTERGAP